ncbi:MAG TPA: threonine--tRNA ligase [Candidatus Saccharibacteria bacterium]|nr:threonine--tRNA ligase [Candidatus Saccharibacteria bacterium]HMT39951.1 threonine--tRNA ligase [Candidatus Saccharibacteria bacterium]
MEHDNMHKIRHSLAHILAAVVQNKHPEAKLGVGPVVENGFYYDMLLNEPLKLDELKSIESGMRKIISSGTDFVREEWAIDDAIEYFSKKGQVYKVELLKDLKQKGTTSLKDAGDSDLVEGNGDIEKVTVYKTGEFVDLCKGPHVSNTAELAKIGFKLTKIAGAYWRGNEENDQLQRIYGVAFTTESELSKFLSMLEEAEKRDHRKLGKELDLFTFSDLVGPGLPMYTPRGTVLIEELKAVLKDLGTKYNMQQVSIPHLAKIELYNTSGHAEKFEDELFMVQSHYKQEFVLKPVNCPHHTQIYASRPRSYRDLPIRYVEQTMQYRDEKPGELGGLQRTRGFTVDDGHTFCTLDQIEQEVEMIIEIISGFYQSLGLWGNHWVSLSVRDSKTPDKYIGDDKDWEQSEFILDKLAKSKGLNAKRMDGEAALYGPKLDFMFKDALGRETQLATVQLDFATPKRFELVYTDQEGSEVNPIMIHRAIFGSFERFIMILIEHFAGAFPLWLAPEQVRVIPVSEKYSDYANGVGFKLKESNIRVVIDNSPESLGKRIRNAEVMKVPYILVVGEKEASSNTVAVRKYQKGDLGSSSIDDFLTTLLENIKNRSL